MNWDVLIKRIFYFESDHCAGNEQLVKHFGNKKLNILGYDERIPELTKQIKHNDEFKVYKYLLF